MVDYDNPRWPLIQAMIRCGLANNPTNAFLHQVKRYQKTFTPDRKEYISIEEMLNVKPDEQFKIVQS